MTPDFDDETTVERIAAAKRRLTDLKLRALLEGDRPRPRAEDIDAVADEILDRIDCSQRADRVPESPKANTVVG